MHRPSTAPSPSRHAPAAASPVSCDITASALAFADPNSTIVLEVLQQVRPAPAVHKRCCCCNHIHNPHHSAAAQAVDEYVAVAAQPVPVAPRDAVFLGQVDRVLLGVY